MRHAHVVAALAIVSVWAGPVSAAVRQVGPTRTYTTVQAAYDAAVSGDTIEIDSGTYFRSQGWVYVNGKHNITFRGVGPTRPVIDAGNSHLRSKGIFVIEIGTTNITIENLELKNARLNVTGANAAGVRAQGTNLTLRNCYIHDCDNGVLGGTGDLLFEYCEFYRNGYGDGQSHNMYISNANSFTLRHSYSHGTVEGHEVKTRAASNYILYNLIHSDGIGSREVQIANGGVAYIIGNVVRQGPNTHNSQIITFGDEGSYATNAAYIVNNTIINERSAGAQFISTRSGSTVLIQNNIFKTQGQGVETILTGPGSLVTNWTTTDAALANLGAHDYRLTAASTGAINAGAMPGVGLNNYPLTPAYQYVHPYSRQDRPTSGLIDIGAYEYVVANQPPTVDAGADLNVYEGQAVSLHAAASDPDTDSLTYLWSQTAGATVSLAGAATADVSFTAPVVATVAQAGLVLQVQVADGKGGSANDSATVRVWLAGDATRDDSVDIFDLLALAGAWNAAAGDPAFDGTCDFNADAAVDIFDLLALADRWNQTLP